VGQEWPDYALDLVVQSIESGAVKHKLNQKTKELIKELYRPGFTRMGEANWNVDQKKVLALAEQAGRAAEVGSILCWVSEGRPNKSFLNKDVVSLVCTIYSRMYCPTTARGGYCPDIKCTEPRERGKRLEKLLVELGY
jgi:hypothetical protein